MYAYYYNYYKTQHYSLNIVSPIDGRMSTQLNPSYHPRVGGQLCGGLPKLTALGWSLRVSEAMRPPAYAPQ